MVTNKTVSDLFSLDDVTGQKIESVEPVAQDNSYLAFEVVLENGIVFEATVKPNHLAASDVIDLPDGLLIDGIPIEEY